MKLINNQFKMQWKTKQKEKKKTVKEKRDGMARMEIFSPQNKPLRLKTNFERKKLIGGTTLPEPWMCFWRFANARARAPTSPLLSSAGVDAAELRSAAST